MTTQLYGKRPDHDALEEYESPEAYAKQGDTRVVRDLSFNYLVSHTDELGREVLTYVDVPQNTVVTVDQIGLHGLAKGEKWHSFYTDHELAQLEGGSVTTEIASANVSDLGEYELAEWLKTPNPDTGKEPTINEVLEKVGDDKELAHRMLQAENIAADGDPRKGLEAGLREIIKS